ncbi:MAG: NUDIX domain-containing protein, partial [Alphaproteobacteria bacterium]|nr:NUDIX domain-containing protein [Alphaproteobacteria bacterium]
MTLPAIIPAATLILFDDREDADALHLMVERAASMAFAAGALVFPGGRVDDDDRAQAAHYPALDPVDAAARIAAIRETLEETGVAAGFAVAP